MGAFDKREYEATRKQYETEAKEKWGKTEAYAEYENKSKDYTGDQYNALAAGMDAVMGEFASAMKAGEDPDSPRAQELVKKLQKYISDHFYTCTDQILSGLGQMYVADERFQQNIDRHGPGTAFFISKAIAQRCG